MSPAALIVAHGQPSDPDPAEADIAMLAEAVAGHLPGWHVGSATLAAPGRLEAAVAGPERPVVFPFFLSDGYFIRQVIPRRLAAAGRGDLRVLSPFGLLADTRELARQMALRACAARGWPPRATHLVLAAHGSGQSRHSAEAAAATASAIAADFAGLRCGFVEETPFLAGILAHEGERSLCLPLFARRWGHVETDLPEAVRISGYRGVMLDPIGTDPGVPALIARAICAG